MKCIMIIYLVYMARRKGPREASESRYSSWDNVSCRPSLTDTFGLMVIYLCLLPLLGHRLPTKVSVLGSLQLVPGHIHGLYICLQFSAQCVSWSASVPLALRVPCQGLTGDVICWLMLGMFMHYPSPTPFLDFVLCRQLVRFLPQFAITDGLWPTDM